MTKSNSFPFWAPKPENNEAKPKTGFRNNGTGAKNEANRLNTLYDMRRYPEHLIGSIMQYAIHVHKSAFLGGGQGGGLVLKDVLACRITGRKCGRGKGSAVVVS